MARFSCQSAAPAVTTAANAAAVAVVAPLVVAVAAAAGKTATGISYYSHPHHSFARVATHYCHDCYHYLDYCCCSITGTSAGTAAPVLLPVRSASMRANSANTAPTLRSSSRYDFDNKAHN